MAGEKCHKLNHQILLLVTILINLIMVQAFKEDQFAQLMRKAQQGDKLAYNQLLLAILPLVRGFINRRIRDGRDNEDIVQEILLAVHRAAHTYNTDRPFKSWLFAIASHKLNDYLRKQYRRQNIAPLDYGLDENILLSDVTNQPTAAEQLKEILVILPDKQQKIISMMKIEGYSAKETALALNKSESAVKVSAHRAYKILLKASKVTSDKR